MIIDKNNAILKIIFSVKLAFYKKKVTKKSG